MPPEDMAIFSVLLLSYTLVHKGQWFVYTTNAKDLKQQWILQCITSSKSEISLQLLYAV